jgi:hypothetical protein
MRVGGGSGGARGGGGGDDVERLVQIRVRVQVKFGLG